MTAGWEQWRFTKRGWQLLKTDTSENLDYLFAKGASSGGARPKILTKVEDEEWIIKFPSLGDSRKR
jgi:serine/threonine-protein kinase HipA